MKRSIALIIVFMLVLTCFSACKRTGVIKGGVMATDFNGNGIVPVVTQENGGIIRDDAGNVIVLATDKNGNTYKENGEYVTQAVAVDHAIIFGKHIETADYAMDIPNGWSDEKSFDDVHIKKDGKADMISISTMRNEKLADVEADNSEMFKLFPGGATTNKTLTVAGEEAHFISAFTTVNGTGVYLGFITFSHQGVVFRCRIGSDRDLSKDIDDIIKIIDTIQFVH